MLLFKLIVSILFMLISIAFFTLSAPNEMSRSKVSTHAAESTGASIK